MTAKLISRLSIGAAILFLFTACGGDQHGSGGVPRPANLDALWMSDTALAQYRGSAGNPRMFCGYVLNNRALHGIEEPFNNEPAARILAIIPGGWVYRWNPQLAWSSRDLRMQSLVGRVDSVGNAATAGRGALRIGRLRLTDPNHLVQDNGEDLFLAANTRLRANTRSSNWNEFNESSSRQIDAGRGFTRVTYLEANDYIDAVRACEPSTFPYRPRPTRQTPVAATQGAAPPVNPGRPALPGRPDRPEAQPARPAAQGGAALPPQWDNQSEVPAPPEEESEDAQGTPAAPPASTGSRKKQTPAVEVDRGAEQDAPTDAAPGYLPRKKR